MSDDASTHRRLLEPPGGVLQDDWKNPHDHKLEIIARAHPNPTKWAPAGTEVIAVAPAADETAVESGVDPAAFAKAAPAASPVQVTAAAGGAAAAPAPPAGRCARARAGGSGGRGSAACRAGVQPRAGGSPRWGAAPAATCAL